MLAGDDADMAEEPPRERLFDVLMRRIELLAPHKAAVRSLMRSAVRNPGLALALQRAGGCARSNGCSPPPTSAPPVRAACVRAQGLALLFASVLRTWVDDDDPGLARTMAALDRALARGQRWSGLLDELCRIPSYACRMRSRRRRPADDADEETVAV